jgi:hypothetical protein
MQGCKVVLEEFLRNLSFPGFLHTGGFFYFSWDLNHDAEVQGSFLR